MIMRESESPTQWLHGVLHNWRYFIHSSLSCQLSLKLLELSLEAIVWMNEVPLLLDMLICVLKGESMLLHQISNHNGSAPRHSSETVNENCPSLRDRFFYEPNANLEILFEIRGRGVQDMYLLIVEKGWEFWSNTLSDSEYMSDSVLLEEELVIGTSHVTKIKSIMDIVHGTHFI